ncbi:MAG: DUF4118 domain-containing protein [Brotaphodocola sp.]
MDRKKEKKSIEVLVKNSLVTVVLMTIATISAELFFRYSENSTSVAIIYVLTVMLVAKYTTGYVPGIIASLFGVVCVNYVFTYPYMNLNFTLDGYPVTFLGMMVVSTVTSAMTTKTKRQNEVLRQSEMLIMEAEKETMRANLLRAVSHDLRTPLTSIIGMAQAYDENAAFLSEKEKQEMVRGIREDAEWLLNMVENLLSVTRIRVEDAKVNTSPELLEEVVAGAVQRLKKRLPQLQVHVKVPDEVLMVPMDPVLISQVLINLMENACYHSKSEEPMDLFVEKKTNCVEFHIRDYGVGIAQERLDIIFDGSGIEGNKSGDSHKGMGIGLTICKTIILAHNGEIWARNRDKGAEFVFTLPLKTSENQDTKD